MVHPILCLDANLNDTDVEHLIKRKVIKGESTKDGCMVAQFFFSFFQNNASIELTFKEILTFSEIFSKSFHKVIIVDFHIAR